MTSPPPKTPVATTTTPSPQDDASPASASGLLPSSSFETSDAIQPPARPYRTYRRRWIGLVQLTLLNIIVSWDWLTFAPVSTSSAQFFSTTETTINWLSTAFLFAFAVASPATIYILNRHGPRGSILAASALIFLGNWLRYAGARAATPRFGLVMFGQILIGLAQPFVLAAPTRYSDMWFTERGRIGATALASLANPLGGALGQLIDPAFASDPSQIPSMVLYVAIISSAVAALSLAVPAAPPSPPSATASARRADFSLAAVRALLANPSFHLLLWPFAVYVTAFNAFSSELNNIMYPYGFDETQAGIAGALLILVGLGASAAASPALDRVPGSRIPAIRALVPVIAALYLAFVWAPQTRDVGAPYAVCALLGSASFVLLPLALELLVETTYPVNPEISSTVCWAMGQVGGGVVIIIMDALKGSWGGGQPAGNMKAGLVFLAVLAWTVVPLPMFLGFRGLGQERRREAERAALVGLDERGLGRRL